jgi:ANTAR domain-containing protein
VGVREAGEALLTRLLETLLAEVPGAVGAGLTLVGEGQPRGAAAVGVAVDLDPKAWGEEGAAREALKLGRPLVLELDAGDAGASVLVASAHEEDADRGLVVTLYLDRPAGNRDLERLDRLQPLLANAVGIVEYCSGQEERAEQMVQMVQYRRVIEQAKGLVMAVTAGDAGSAFATLARASQHFNVRLRNLAVALVELVGRAPAEGPTDPGAVVTPSDRDRAAAEQMWAALTTPRPGAPGAAGDAGGVDGAA